MRFHISFEVIVFSLITCILSFTLIRSIYISVSDLGRYRLYDLEKQKLEELNDENQKLRQRKEYYESKYYETLYARQAFNLAKNNQEIFYIERRGLYDFSAKEEKGQEINLSDYRNWWIRLIL